MDLTILFDHRYVRQADGSVLSKTHYNYSLFSQRYLRVFDRVQILARIDDGQLGETPLGPGVSVVSLGNWNSPFGLLRRRRQVLQIINTHLDSRAAVMIIAPGTVGSLAIDRLLRQQRPYGVEVVGDPAESLGGGAVKHLLRPLICWKFCRSMRQICQQATTASYVTRETLQRQYPPGAQTRASHYSSIELQDEAFVEQPRPSSTQSRWRIVHIGTMSQPYKAQEVLIDAVSECRSRGLDIELALVGEGRLRADLESQVRRLAMEPHVQFLGHLPPGAAIRDQLDRADLFVLPSRTEGLPRTMLEAMARGVPCLGSNVGGIPELLDPSELAPVNDCHKLAEKIRGLLLDSDRMSRLSRRNLELSQDYHDRILNARRIAIYEHLRDASAQWMNSAKKVA